MCTRKGYAASVSQLALATAALYFSFFKLKKWGKKTAETRRCNCAVLPYIYMCVIPLLQCPETVGDLLLNYSVEYII